MNDGGGGIPDHEFNDCIKNCHLTHHFNLVYPHNSDIFFPVVPVPLNPWQESCVLVEVQAMTPKVAASRPGFGGGVGKDRGKDELPPAIPGSLSSDIGTMSRSSSKGTTSDKEGGHFYFIPCILPVRRQ